MHTDSRGKMRTGRSGAALLLLFSGTAAGAQTVLPREAPFFISPSRLAEEMGHPSLVLLHVGDRAEFEAEHITGAQYIATQDLSTPRGQGLTLQVPPIEQLQATLGGKGIRDDSRIVICFGGDWVTPAARVFLTLEYAGLGDRTSLLDGGLAAWKKDGRPVTTELRAPPAGRLDLHPRDDIIVDVNWLAGRIDDEMVKVLDARTPNYYDGSSAGRMPRAGRIPGAVNIPYTAVVDEAGKLRSRENIEELFRQASVRPEQTVVTYCHIGQQASLLYLVSRMLGYEARLFDGSFEEWSARNDLPVLVPEP